ncbi:MAG: hypothetical protein KIH63_002975 [Candidatus Saccharibacteria bacterium]|nr:hypothetical protein [Candidatus Saccharibacteria bacterium]
MAHNNHYVSIGYISNPETGPHFDIALPDGVWNRAVMQDPDFEGNFGQLNQRGLAFLQKNSPPIPDDPGALVEYDPQIVDHLHLWPGRMRVLDLLGGDERRFTEMTLNEFAGTVIAEVPHAVQQSPALRLKKFSSDGTPTGFSIEADIVLPRQATDPLLRQQALTAMAEVSMAYGLKLDPSNKPSAVVDSGRNDLTDAQPWLSLSPRPHASLAGEPLEYAPTVWHLTSEGLNNREQPLVVLAGLVALTTEASPAINPEQVFPGSGSSY